MNASQIVSLLVVIAFAFVECTKNAVESPVNKYPAEDGAGSNDDDVNNQSRLFELLYSLVSKNAIQGQNPFSGDDQLPELSRESRRFEPVAGSWERFYNPRLPFLRKRAPCLLNAGLSHGCDVMDFLAAKHQQSKFADFAGPGRKRR